MDDPALIKAVARALCKAHCGTDCQYRCDETGAWALLKPDATAAIAAHDAWLRSAGMAVVPVDLELARRRLGELNECAPITDCSDCEQGLTTSCLRRAEAVLLAATGEDADNE